MMRDGNRRELRETALALFRAAIEAADPRDAVERALAAKRAELAEAGRIYVAAFGKAALPMMRAALPFCSERLSRAVAVTNPENMAEMTGVEVIAGGHPLPTHGSIDGALAVEALAREARAGDLLLVLVSGGGSALLCAPAGALTLDDKIAVNDALIRSGADISEINVVRSALSRLKGGGLARIASPARLLALVLSDVPGDDLATVASGPTVPAKGSTTDAQDILRRHGLQECVPPAVLHHLEGSQALSGPDAYDHAKTSLIGSNGISVAAAREQAGRLGWEVADLSERLEGDVADAAALLHRQALEAAGNPGRVALICGGETTVRVTGKGVGGRNQELALRFALLAEEQPLARAWCFLSGGTDGRDGPTDAAGGLVDGTSLSRMREAGIDPQARLRANDAYPALDSSGDLIRIGATGTNVADIQILLLG